MVVSSFIVEVRGHAEWRAVQCGLLMWPSTRFIGFTGSRDSFFEQTADA
jgi:hypothetical protein